METGIVHAFLALLLLQRYQVTLRYLDFLSASLVLAEQETHLTSSVQKYVMYGIDP